MLRVLSRKISHEGQKKPVTIAVTGGAGQISYNLVFRIANGSLFGESQPVSLVIYDLPYMKNSLKGIKMELEDCAFPLLKNVTVTDNATEAFLNTDYAFLIGAKPRVPGMEISELLKQNADIFVKAGKDIGKYAKKNIKVLTIGNPANTNCLLTMTHAKGIPKQNFASMTKLDHNRAMAQVAEHFKVKVDEIDKVAIWGNHSPTVFADLSHLTINSKLMRDKIDKNWYSNTFIPTIQQRGTAILNTRKFSSAAAGAHAAIDQMRNWELGSHNKWVSFGVSTDLLNGEYSIPAGLVFSYPCICTHSSYHVIKGLHLDEFAKTKIKITIEELLKEREAVADLL